MVPDKRGYLHHLIDAHFSEDELRDLCFELGGVYDYDALSGESKRAKARELVATALRRCELTSLLDLLAEENPAVPWDEAVVPDLLILATPRGRLLIVALAVLFLLSLVALPYWVYFGPSEPWVPPYVRVPKEELGIAVAELGISADCRRGAAGREASRLLYETLEKQIHSVGLKKRAPLTKVGLVCNQEQAIAEGKRVDADIVIWGWVPRTTEGLLGQYTFVEPVVAAGATSLAESLELLVSGPAQAPYYRLSGQTEALVRFMLGLVYAKDKQYESSLEMFDRAIGIIEADDNGVNTDSLAVVYTERGKTQAAMKNLDLAFESYQKAEALNPDYLGLQIALGTYYYALRDWDTARRYYDKASLQQEELPNVPYGYGLLDYYTGDFDRAVANFQLAVEYTLAHDQEPLLPWLAMGYTYIELGMCPEAITAFDNIRRSETAEDELRRVAEMESANCASRVATPTLATTAIQFPIPTIAGGVKTSSTVTPPPGAILRTICIRSATALRKGAGEGYAVLAMLPAGTSVQWLANIVGVPWFLVRLGDGRAGWIAAVDAMPCSFAPTLLGALTSTPTPFTTRALFVPESFTQTPTPTLLPTVTLLPEPPPPTETLLPYPQLTPSPVPTLLPTMTLTPQPTPTETPTEVAPIDPIAEPTPTPG